MRPLPLLTQEQIQERLSQLDPAWKQEGHHIVREWTFASFIDGIQFVNRVAKIAEELNHHPDIHISYRDVRLSLTTHYKGGVTARDFRLAGRIDLLWQEARNAETPGEFIGDL